MLFKMNPSVNKFALKYSFISLFLFVIFYSNSLFANPIKLLVFSKTNGYRHKSIAAGKESFANLAKDNNWVITFTEDSLYFSNYATLKQYDVVIFLYCSGKIFDTAEENAFKKYINNGGGFVSIHTGTDCEKNWDWYMDMVGAKFKAHPKQQKARFVVLDNNHPATKNMPKEWSEVDEIYNFIAPVPKNVKTLIEVDESSYTGGTMGKHPLVWYHYYEGGRVFQSAIGHNDSFYKDKLKVNYLVGAIRWAAKAEDISLSNKFTPLIDDSLTNFDKYLGVPDKSLALDLARDTAGNYLRQLGLNNDLLNVYSTRKEGKETILHISGQMYGGLITKEEYGDYHFKASFRWGHNKYAPRLNNSRDNGILYHCVGPNGVFWKVWKQSLECQVQEKDMGDLFCLSGTSGSVHCSKVVGENPAKPTQYTYTYDKKDSLREVHGRVHRSKNYEKTNGEWNTIEIITKGDTSIHIINGHVNNVIINAKQKRDGIDVPLHSGKIIIQSEGAEAEYKDMLIKHIEHIPVELLKEAGLN